MQGKINRLKKFWMLFSSFQMGKTQLNYLPLRMWVEPTNKCNLKCIICPNSTDTSSERGYMDLELFISLLDECKNDTYDINLSHRGESLFHKDIVEMVKEAKNRGIYTRIHTNATLLNEDISKELIQAGLDLLSFSIDGYDRSGYESIRKGGDFDKVMGNIHLFLNTKKSSGSDFPYTILQIIETKAKENNREKREEFARQFIGLPLDCLYIKLPHNWAGNIDLKGKAEIEESIYTHPISPCTFPWYSATVLWDGRVVPCPQDWYGEMEMGNLKKENLRKIWNSEKYIALRDKMKRKDFTDLPLCRVCDRVRRRTIMGIPLMNLKKFLSELIQGYKHGKRRNRGFDINKDMLMEKG